jgi:paraquat-inducible protein B
MEACDERNRQPVERCSRFYTALKAPAFEVEPERILGVGAKAVYKTPAEAVAAVLQRGLRASLGSASLLTGQQMVTLEFVPNAPAASVTMAGSDFVLPTTSSGRLGGLQPSASDLLNNVNTIPFKQIGERLEDLLQSVNDVTNGAQIHQALTDLAAMMGCQDARYASRQWREPCNAPTTGARHGPAENADEYQQAGPFARQ